MCNLPELQASFISRYLSLTDEALRPSTAPIDVQSEPSFLRSLAHKNIVIRHHQSKHSCMIGT